VRRGTGGRYRGTGGRFSNYNNTRYNNPRISRNRRNKRGGRLAKFRQNFNNKIDYQKINCNICNVLQEINIESKFGKTCDNCITFVYSEAAKCRKETDDHRNNVLKEIKDKNINVETDKTNYDEHELIWAHQILRNYKCLICNNFKHKTEYINIQLKYHAALKICNSCLDKESEYKYQCV